MKKKNCWKKGLSRKRENVLDLWTTVRFINTVLSCFYFWYTHLSIHQCESGLRSRQIFLRLRLSTFFQAAPAPDFFPKRLQLLDFFSSGSRSVSKEPKTPGSGSPALMWPQEIYFITIGIIFKTPPVYLIGNHWVLVSVSAQAGRSGFRKSWVALTGPSLRHYSTVGTNLPDEIIIIIS